MSTFARIDGAVNKDNTFAALMGDYQNPAYAASIALQISQQAAKTLVQVALTGPVSFTVNVGDDTADDTGPYVGDQIVFLLSADSSARTATFGTGFSANGTLTVAASGTAIIYFEFNGAVWLQTQVGNPRDVVSIQSPAYGATIAIAPTVKTTKYFVAQLTGAATINATVTGLVQGDVVVLAFSADGTNRTVTFGTNFQSSATLTVTANKYGTASFIFNGTYLVETGRAATA